MNAEPAQVVVGVALGAAVASFLNVLADRLPQHRSPVFPSSHCPSCGRRLRAYEMVPVLSYVVLGGRCRTCGARIPRRVLAVEAVGGAGFGLLVARYGVSVDTLLLLGAFSFLLLITVIDLEHQLILNGVLAVAAPVAAGSALLWSEGMRHPALSVGGQRLSVFVDALAAAGFGLAIILLIVVGTRGRGMGVGDLKFAGVLGLWLGVRLLPVALMLAVVGGGVVASALLVSRLRGRKDLIPFGPFLAVGAGVALVWGEGLRAWYLDLVR